MSRDLGGVALVVNGAALLALPSGALWWPDRRTLVVADLHLEKGSAFARNGRMLPPYDSVETLRRLAMDIDRQKPAQVIALGDSFHDRDGPSRLPSAEGQVLASLINGRSWIWITGNHDPTPEGPWGGSVVSELVEGPLRFRHDAAAGTVSGEVSGHYHPKAAILTRGRRYAARCFVSDGCRLIIPAYGAFTGGLSVLDQAISGLLHRDFWAYLTAPGRVLAVPRHRLIPAR